MERSWSLRPSGTNDSVLRTAGNPHAERGARPFGAVQVHVTAVGLNNPADDPQAQPQPRLRATISDALESVEDAVMVSRRNPISEVGDDDERAVLVWTARDLDGPPFAVFAGV